MKEIEVYLYVQGFECSADEISTSLGITPDKVVIKGQVSPGQTIPAKFSSIQLYSTTAECEELDLQILCILDKIADLDLFKREVQNRKLSCSITSIYRIIGDYTPPCAMYISSSTMAKLIQLGCDIDLDING